MSLTIRPRDARSRAQVGIGPSMTPMVDVVLVILVFFMASAALLAPEWLLSVALPSRQGDSATEPDPFALPTPTFTLRLAVGGDGKILASGLGLENADLDAARARIAGLVRAIAPEGVTLLLAPADGVPYEAVVRMRDDCERAGVERVGLR